MTHTPIVRHPDLSKLTDKQLKIELEYTIQTIYHTTIQIRNRATDIRNRAFSRLEIPAWKLGEDLAGHLDRLQAIVDELEYRQIP